MSLFDLRLIVLRLWFFFFNTTTTATTKTKQQQQKTDKTSIRHNLTRKENLNKEKEIRLSKESKNNSYKLAIRFAGASLNHLLNQLPLVVKTGQKKSWTRQKHVNALYRRLKKNSHPKNEKLKKKPECFKKKKRINRFGI